MATESARRCDLTATLPPDGVNFTAFIRRFHTTCCRRSGAQSIVPSESSSVATSLMSLARAAGRTVSSAASIVAFRSARSKSSRMRPATIRERSSRSSTRRVWAEALRRMALMARARPAEDRVQRCTELVRDGGEQLVLRGVEGFGLLARLLLARQQQSPLVLQAPPLGDVARDLRGAHDVA